jgi:FlaA1/EpsC-like NDP-sugar epimerase
VDRTTLSSRLKREMVRYLPSVAVDGVIATSCFAIALILRFGGRVPLYYLDWFSVAAPYIAAAYCLSAMAFRLYQRIWRYASLYDLMVLTGAVAVATTTLLIADAIVYPLDHPLPLSVIPIGGVLTYLCLAAAKFGPRIRRFLISGFFPRGKKGVVIVGAGQTGQLLAREMLRKPEWDYQPVCFVDDDRTKLGLRIHGVPVRGSVGDLPKLIASYEASVVALALGSATAADRRLIVDVVQECPVQLKIVPGIGEVLSGHDKHSVMREVHIADLLDRDPVSADLAACASCVAGRTVLVTGAAGSIGSELSRQLLALAPTRLILFDNNESAVHDLTLELRQEQPAVGVVPHVGSVTNRAKLEVLFERWAPDIVFHAAAYKHVPLMEEFPEEAVEVNVLGTRTLASVAHEYGVDRFVLVSTDKAVNACNVMGATKRLAELLIKDLANRSETVFCAVRFGNVLGSRGSVIPIFTRQIESGGPLTITHPDMTRFFMTIPEAASLIIQASALASPGDIFVLDMGEQVRIVDLAEKMARFRGLILGRDIAVRYIGLRPGEKLTEELVQGCETVSPTSHPKVMRLSGDESLPNVEAVVSRLESLVWRNQPDLLRAALFDAACAGLPLLAPTDARPAAIQWAGTSRDRTSAA